MVTTTLEQNKAAQEPWEKLQQDAVRKLVELRNEEAVIRYSATFPIGKRIFLKKAEYEVTGYAYFYSAAIQVRKVNKDGLLSKREQYFSSWDIGRVTDKNGHRIIEVNNE